MPFFGLCIGFFQLLKLIHELTYLEIPLRFQINSSRSFIKQYFDKCYTKLFFCIFTLAECLKLRENVLTDIFPDLN